MWEISEKNRNNSIDLLKAAASYLICYSHFNNQGVLAVADYYTPTGIMGYALQTLAAYAVPVFLLINGYLVIYKEYALRVYIKKSVHLALVTFLWGMLYNILFSMVFQEEKSLMDIIRIIYQGGVYEGRYISIRNWFFWTLVIIWMFLPFISIVFREQNQLMAWYLFGVVFLFTIGNDLISRILLVVSLYSNVNLLEFSNILPKINVFSSWDSFALTYFLAGGLIYRHRKEISKRYNRTKAIVLIGVFFVVLMLYGLWYMQKTESYYNIVWNGYPSIALFAGAVILFYGLVEAELKIPDKLLRVVIKISSNSMGIYFVHLVIGTLLKPIYLSMAGRENLLMGIGFSLVVFLCSFGACEILKRIPIVKYMIKF